MNEVNAFRRDGKLSKRWLKRLAAEFGLPETNAALFARVVADCVQARKLDEMSDREFGEESIRRLTASWQNEPELLAKLRAAGLRPGPPG